MHSSRLCDRGNTHTAAPSVCVSRRTARFFVWSVSLGFVLQRRRKGCCRAPTALSCCNSKFRERSFAFRVAIDFAHAAFDHRTIHRRYTSIACLQAHRDGWAHRGSAKYGDCCCPATKAVNRSTSPSSIDANDGCSPSRTAVPTPAPRARVASAWTRRRLIPCPSLCVVPSGARTADEGCLTAVSLMSAPGVQARVRVYGVCHAIS